MKMPSSPLNPSRMPPGEGTYLLMHEMMLDGRPECKIVGVYSSEAEASLAQERVKGLPGFSGTPEGFQIHKYPLDSEHWNWRDGFTVVGDGAST